MSVSHQKCSNVCWHVLEQLLLLRGLQTDHRVAPEPDESPSEGSSDLRIRTRSVGRRSLWKADLQVPGHPQLPCQHRWVSHAHWRQRGRGLWKHLHGAKHLSLMSRLCLSVAGHEGCLVFGTIEDTPCVFMQGHFHLYEGYSLCQVSSSSWCTGEQQVSLNKLRCDRSCPQSVELIYSLL